MREIKFRAWCPGYSEDDDKYYMYPVTKIDFDGMGLDGKQEIWVGIFDGYNHNYIEESGAIVMQYTGLKDKNGKEIYEGDIINQDLGKEFDKILEIVRYDNENGCYYLSENEKWDGEYSLGECIKMGGCEIIGNIYENAELLK